MRTNKTVFTLSVVALSLVAGHAAAGPDWSTIEHGRAMKRAEQANAVMIARAGSERECQLSAGPGAAKPETAK